MKKLLVVAIILFSTLAFGNEKARIIAKYEATVRMGNIITRLYYDIVGTSLLFKEKLILFSDNTYSYTYKGGECGTFDTKEAGTWSISNDTMYLKNDQADLNKVYIIKDNKLYESNSDRTKDKWILKLNR